MNKEELIITNEDIELLKEMKNNCLKTDVYNDEKRLLKANAITKFLMLQQENNQLKEQYCERTDCGGRIGNSRKVEKLKQENKELHKKIDKAIKLNNQIIKDTKGFYRPTSDTIYSGDTLIDIAEQNLKILGDSDINE